MEMQFKDLTSKLTLKNVAFGLALALGAEGMVIAYTSAEERFGQESFCEEYGYLKMEPRSVIDRAAAQYWPRIHPSNREAYFNTFAGWLEQCK